MTKYLWRDTMEGSKLKKSFSKTRNQVNWCKYKSQKNCYVNLLSKTKLKYFKTLNVECIQTTKLTAEEQLLLWKPIITYTKGFSEIFFYEEINSYLENKLLAFITGF